MDEILSADATGQLAALASRRVSAAALLALALKRCENVNSPINAVVAENVERATAAARAVDEARAKGETLGPLAGLPMTVKDTFDVEGLPASSGLEAYRRHDRPDAVVVARARAAGAVIWGKTNTPVLAGDWQTTNPLYGTTNNPWDLTRTPGGSSGGSAATLAAGLAFLSIGSDIGGSIRTPASFCGIYGHKPTLDIMSQAGHLPGGIESPPGFSTLLAVGGPMARSAEDLEAALRILAGPEPPDSKAYQWTLPAPRHEKLSDYRIGYVLEDSAVPVSAETKSVLESAIRACETAGAKITRGWPENFQFQEILDVYMFLLVAFDYSMMPRERQEKLGPRLAARQDMLAQGMLTDFAQWQWRNRKRLGYRALWERYFANVDVFLLPTVFTTAFPHDRTPQESRMVPTPEGAAQPFWDITSYIAPATLTGCPATTAPAGLSKSGLPVGIQIVGPYLEDATPIAFARLLAREIGGFQPPPGFGRLEA